MRTADEGGTGGQLAATDPASVRSHEDVARRRDIQARIDRLREAAERSEFTLGDGVGGADGGDGPVEPSLGSGALEGSRVSANRSATVLAEDEPTTPAFFTPSEPRGEAQEDGGAAEPEPGPEPSPGERIDALSMQLADAVIDEAREDYTPVPAMVRLATLELLSPGVFNSRFPRFDASSGGVSVLSEDDIALVSAWRDLFRGLRRSLGEAGADLDAIAMAAEDLHNEAARWRTLDVPSFVLCRRVDGFGVYEPFPTFDGGVYKLLAGRRHALVVYAEATHFSHKPATRGAARGFEVSFDQHLTLFHAGTPRVRADRDLVAWRTERERIGDFSRNRRRDFYTVQVIRLPESLSVGAYRLKLTLEDLNSGETAERVLDIEVVADASAFREGATVSRASAPGGE